jgi:hypothetical protein
LGSFLAVVAILGQRVPRMEIIIPRQIFYVLKRCARHAGVRQALNAACQAIVFETKPSSCLWACRGWEHAIVGRPSLRSVISSSARNMHMGRSCTWDVPILILNSTQSPPNYTLSPHRQRDNRRKWKHRPQQPWKQICYLIRESMLSKNTTTCQGHPALVWLSGSATWMISGLSVH